jgi:hypothetical protein
VALSGSSSSFAGHSVATGRFRDIVVHKHVAEPTRSRALAKPIIVRVAATACLLVSGHAITKNVQNTDKHLARSHSL